MFFSRLATLKLNGQSFSVLPPHRLSPSKELEHLHFCYNFKGADLARSRSDALLLVSPEDQSKSLENTQQVKNQRAY